MRQLAGQVVYWGLIILLLVMLTSTVQVRYAVIDEVALGVFTHRTTYLPGLLGSLRKIGDPACVVVCADGPINANMARLWEAFKRTEGAVLGLPG